MMATLDARRHLAAPAGLVPARPGDYFDAHLDPEEDAVLCAVL